MEHPSEFFVRKHPTERGLCFVIMPFSGDLGSVYEFVIKPFIEGLGMRCVRADELYGNKPIMSDVWNAIQRAELVIADLTGRNPNVMYELGLCHALWKNVILITQKGEDVPFDLRGYRLIIYEPSIGGAERLKGELARTIEAVRKEPLIEGCIVRFEQPSQPSVARFPRAEGVVEAVAKTYMLIKLNDGRQARMEADDLSWVAKINDLTEKFRVGDKVRGVLLSESQQPCAFSIKHLRPDPWPEFQQKHPIGSTFIGRIINFDTRYGLFVEVEPHFIGLIPKKIVPTSEPFSKGEVIRALIESIDPSRKSILLKYKGRPLEVFEKYSVNKAYQGKVIAVRDFGLLIELEPGVTAICHISQFSNSDQSSLPDLYPVGKEFTWIVKRVDPRYGRIELSPQK